MRRRRAAAQSQEFAGLCEFDVSTVGFSANTTYVVTATIQLPGGVIIATELSDYSTDAFGNLTFPGGELLVGTVLEIVVDGVSSGLVTVRCSS